LSPGKGVVILGRMQERKEDYALPKRVMDKIREANEDAFR